MPLHHLVTGGAGFIGSHLVESLLRDGHRVTVLDDLSTGTLANLEAVQDHPELTIIKGSVLDEALVDQAVDDADVVMHLAAAVGVRLIVEEPLSSLATNIRGAEVVLAAAARRGCRTLVTSSSEIYGRNPNLPLAEEDDRVLGEPSIARWSYSTSKAVEEILAFLHHREHGLPVVVVRLFNTVGPRQRGEYGMALPRFVAQALAGSPLTVHGEGRQTRCFCHVEDIVNGLRGLVDSHADGIAVNLGSTEEVSILELAQRVVDRAGSDSPITLIPYAQDYGAGFEDAPRRVPDTRRVHELTGWEPQKDLDAIIDDVVAHARAAW
jgi:UDP-glucose 4-epimerase